MSDDPITRLVKLRIIKATQDIEQGLAQKAGGGIAIEILYRLRDRVAESLGALAFLNVDDPQDRIKMKALQNEVKRYDEWITWLHDIVAEGHAYDQQISADDREEMIDYLMQTAEGTQEAIELGLVEPQPRDI